MRSVHLPRRFAMLLLILLAAAFLTGIMLAFTGVHAAPEGALVPAATGTPDASTTPEQTEQDEILVSADTTGILVLGILLVAIILIGLLWGGRMGRR